MIEFVLMIIQVMIQSAAQKLYEGYGDGGLISYPRTDSTRMSLGFIKTAWQTQWITV